MPNQHVLQRLTGLQSILVGVHQSIASIPSVSSTSARMRIVAPNVAGASSRFFSGGTELLTGGGGAVKRTEQPHAPRAKILTQFGQITKVARDIRISSAKALL
jgi:hypothetical protein